MSFISFSFTMVKTDGDKIDETHPFAKHLGAGGPLPRFVAFDAKEGSRKLGKRGAVLSVQRQFFVQRSRGGSCCSLLNIQSRARCRTRPRWP